VSKKVNECDLCTLSCYEKYVAAQCYLQRVADERGVKVEDLRAKPVDPTVPQTEVRTYTVDGDTYHSSSPRSEADWDELMRQAKKRDEEARRRK